MKSERVSIIMPAYNCERFIAEAIRSVQAQTHTDWELLAVDDCSKDNTGKIIKEFAENDGRIKYIKNDANIGAAASRNKAIDAAVGRYIAFLDGDDVWESQKLERQLSFMEANGSVFSCTDYKKIDENSAPLGIVISAIDVDYEGLLKRCPGNSTVIYDAEKLGKYKVAPIRNREDYLMWLNIIKKAKRLCGMHEALGSHRVGMKSLSSNKIRLVKYHWRIYRNIERLSFFKSVWLTGFWIFRGVFHIR